MATRTYDERDVQYELAQLRTPEKRFIRQLLDAARYPNAFLIVRVLAFLPWVKSKFRKPTVSSFRKWDDQPVLLVGLWEKGSLRKDIENLINTARSGGMYVVGVNTAKLSSEYDLEKFFDVYIERFNYGRDFGSYKVGFEYLEKSLGLHRIPRILLLNDSVYFLEKSTPQFLEQMLTSTKDVLGATENFEIRRHFGSFAISIGNQVLRNPLFLKFWSKYRMSDLRTKVIRKGEMGLTKVLERCATSSENFAPLYSVSTISAFLKSSPKNLDKALDLTVHSRNHWRKLTMNQVLEAWRDRNLFTAVSQSKTQYLNLESVVDSIGLATNMSGAEKDLRRIYPNLDKNLSIKEVREIATGALLLTCVSGSQIHQNGLLFSFLGCPLVKLDVIYRGTWSYEDSEKLLDSLEVSEREYLSTLIYSRAYGEDVLRGWRRSAFMRGLI